MLKIYGVPISVHTRKVLVAARAKKVPFENVPVIPFNPPADWDRMSPTGKIPIATDDDLMLSDSSVISAYLERMHPAPALYPAETRAYARRCGSRNMPTAQSSPGSCTGSSSRR